MLKELNKLYKVHQEYVSSITKLEKSIKPKVKFKFAIIHQPSDGFCLLDEDNSSLISLSIAIKIIQDKGILTKDEFNQHLI